MSKGLIILAASIVLVTAVYAATSSTNGSSIPMVSGVNQTVTSGQVPVVTSGQASTNASMPATTTTMPVGSTSSMQASSQSTTTPSPIKAGQSYSMIQLLQLGYAVEAKGFAEGEAVSGAIAKSAVWKINGGTQDFWQGIVTSDGQFVLTQQLFGSENSTVSNSDWAENK